MSDLKCLKVFSIFSVILLTCSSLSLSSFAALLVDSSDDEDAPSNDVYTWEDVTGVQDHLPVVVVPQVEEDTPYAVQPFAGGERAVYVIGDTPPKDPPFYGSCYVTGHDKNLGDVTVYFPINYKRGYFGVDANGWLFNVNSASISGYLNGVRNNQVTVSGFSYPVYRLPNGAGGYTTHELLLTPTESNMHIAVDSAPRMDIDDISPYLIIAVLVVILLCSMKRS